MGWKPAGGDDAIHDNVAGEIAAVAEKGAPVNADLVLIEDSAAGNAKKRAQLGNLPGGGGGGSVPQWMEYRGGRQGAPDTAHADDDFFTADSSADYTEVVASGSATWVYGTYDSLECEFENQSNVDWAVAVKAIPAAGVPITIETRLDPGAMENNSYIAAGLCFTSGTATSSEMFVVGFGSASNIGRMLATSADGNTVTSADWSTVQIVHGGPKILRLIWSAANTFDIAVSTKGARWTDLGQGSFTRTFTPTHMGFAVTSYGNADPSLISYDYLRVFESDLSV